MFPSSLRLTKYPPVTFNGIKCFPPVSQIFCYAPVFHKDEEFFYPHIVASHSANHIRTSMPYDYCIEGFACLGCGFLHVS